MENVVEKNNLGDEDIEGKIILSWIPKNSNSFRTGPK
jgi:hypothetical protein